MKLYLKAGRADDGNKFSFYEINGIHIPDINFLHSSQTIFIFTGYTGYIRDNAYALR